MAGTAMPAEIRPQRPVEASHQRPPKPVVNHAPAPTAVDHLLRSLREDRYLVSQKEGRYWVSRDLLTQHGLSQESLATPEIQRALRAIRDQQVVELNRILAYVEEHPAHLRYRHDHWTLHDPAPADLRDLIESWNKDDLVQKAFRERRDKALSTDRNPTAERANAPASPRPRERTQPHAGAANTDPSANIAVRRAAQAQLDRGR